MLWEPCGCVPRPSVSLPLRLGVTKPRSSPACAFQASPGVSLIPSLCHCPISAHLCDPICLSPMSLNLSKFQPYKSLAVGHLMGPSRRPATTPLMPTLTSGLCLTSLGGDLWSPVPRAELGPSGSLGVSEPLASQCTGMRTAPKPKNRLEPGTWEVEGGSQVGAGLPGGHVIIQVRGRTESLLPAHPVSPTRHQICQESQRASPPQVRLPDHRAVQLGSSTVRRLGGQVKALKPRGVMVEHFTLRAEHTSGQGRVGSRRGGGMQETENFRYGTRQKETQTGDKNRASPARLL